LGLRQPLRDEKYADKRKNRTAGASCAGRHGLKGASRNACPQHGRSRRRKDCKTQAANPWNPRRNPASARMPGTETAWPCNALAGA